MSGRVCTRAFNPAIRAAVALFPDPLRRMLEFTPFFLGVDTHFIGLHDYRSTTKGGVVRWYSEIAHVVFPTPASWANRPAVVLPFAELSDDCLVEVVVHELGHVVDWLTGRRFHPASVSEYARVDRDEAVAEWFAAWHVPGYWGQDRRRDWLALGEPPEMVAILSGLQA